MSKIEYKIKDFFKQEAKKAEEKIEKTPIEKFFIIFLVIITFSAVALGYLQLRKNIEGPFFSDYLSQKRSAERSKYLNAQGINSANTNTSFLTTFSNTNFLGCVDGVNCAVNSDLNSNSNSAGDMSESELLAVEQKLLSGETTLKDLGIDNADLQAKIDEMRQSGVTINANLTSEEKSAVATLKNINASELRQELISQGVDEATLKNLSDDDLQKMFLQILNQYQ